MGVGCFVVEIFNWDLVLDGGRVVSKQVGIYSGSVLTGDCVPIGLHV